MVPTPGWLALFGLAVVWLLWWLMLLLVLLALLTARRSGPLVELFLGMNCIYVWSRFPGLQWWLRLYCVDGGGGRVSGGPVGEVKFPGPVYQVCHLHVLGSL